MVNRRYPCSSTRWITSPTDGLLYRWDFGASSNYEAETVTGDSALAFVEGSGHPFRGQFVDDFGRKGIIAGNNDENVFNGIQYSGNTGLWVIGNQTIKDSFDMSDMSFVVNFSIRDDYYLSGVKRADVRFGFDVQYGINLHIFTRVKMNETLLSCK
jgi:hypothetical protein